MQGILYNGVQYMYTHVQTNLGGHILGVFFLQAGLCYIPKFVWNASEGGLMKTIAEGLNPGLHREDEVSSRKKVIIDYIVKHIRVSKHKRLKVDSPIGRECRFL